MGVPVAWETEGAGLRAPGILGLGFLWRGQRVGRGRMMRAPVIRLGLRAAGIRIGKVDAQVGVGFDARSMCRAGRLDARLGCRGGVGVGRRALGVGGLVSRLRGEALGPRAAGARIGITGVRVGAGSLCAVNVLGGAV